ncbi:metal-dependent hydrolase [Rapidithrix thailandica]|uniref:Metal-dependent hydrolase n=1 Tax=Rapidithrix thailandica TaxID=413964 RepID=A0AAW9S4R7_9BACT
MDSLTQIVLGASVGEAVCGRKIGNKALLWGAIAGTIPDLDVIANNFLDVVGQLSFHRSITHSFLFAIFAAPLFGWLLHKIYPKSQATFRDWSWLFFWGFVTHSLLDCFTTWGTQLFYPFSREGIAFYTVFVVDPFYTLPFLILVISVLFFKRSHPKRSFLNWTGIALSSGYLLFAVVSKQMANRVFEKNLSEQGIAYSDYISKPTPLNALLWAITVETQEGYYTGFYSLLDANDQVKFTFSPKNHQLLQPYLGNPKVQRLLEVTKGYYTVQEAPEGYYINDLRFGKFNGWQGSEDGHFVFVYHLIDKENELRFEQKEYKFRPDGEYLLAFFNRIMGEKG